jgi:oligopeptide/dipeptide ABC transporter ATP-binding protein
MLRRNPLIEIINLKTQFFLDEGLVRAVNGVDLTIHYGQTVGLVGESGCGKSVMALSILRLVTRPGRIVEGKILLHRQNNDEGSTSDKSMTDLATLKPNSREIRSIRGKDIAMIFQEPMTALSPVYTVGNQITEAILLHQKVDRNEARHRAIRMLDRVGIPNATQRIDDYPFQFSGGMRQRVVIAMALCCNPVLLIADEPTTALDVTTEAQILDLMRDLQHEMGMAILFITHNLGVIAEMAEEVAVMYLGQIMERADVDSIFYNPRHPYTSALLRAIPRVGPKVRQRLEVIPGWVPDPYNWPQGCVFGPRCQEFQQGLCDQSDPPVIDLGEGHWVRCHRRTN